MKGGGGGGAQGETHTKSVRECKTEGGRDSERE